MSNVVPGFVWHPIDVSGRAKRAKGRGLIAHVAVSESANLVPSGTPATRSADWHFYLPKSGPGIQYIDLDYQCWSSASANATCPAFESQGGVNSPQTEPWTANQIELAAQILAYLHKTEGTPLQVMPNSLPSSKGIGPHRWGISPWRVPGGEVWSSSNGKVCPGDAKVAQLPLIVLRAAQIVNGSPTPTVQQEDDMAVLRDPSGTIWMWSGADLISTADGITSGVWQKAAGAYRDVTWPELDAVKFYVTSRRDRELVGAQNYILGANPKDKPYLYDRVVGLGSQVDAVAAAVGKVAAPVIDEAKLAAALLADPTAVQALGKAIADNLQLTQRANG